MLTETIQNIVNHKHIGVQQEPRTQTKGPITREDAYAYVRTQRNQGVGFDAIADGLNRMGYRSPKGKVPNYQIVEYMYSYKPKRRGRKVFASEPSRMSKADATRLVRELRNEEWSYSEIAVELGDRGYRTATGKRPGQSAAWDLINPNGVAAHNYVRNHTLKTLPPAQPINETAEERLTLINLVCGSKTLPADSKLSLIKTILG